MINRDKVINIKVYCLLLFKKLKKLKYFINLLVFVYIYILDYYKVIALNTK
jgi:hypothetical protein